ncbi:MAG: prolyl oligopeptidase family serine peptidase [Tyzzerella sp.]|nr:prolyl oligopeptidase family serine peptidase [Tyzzerella sp.]
MEVFTFEQLQYVMKKPSKLRKKNPTIIFLHGAGTRGVDISVLSKNAFFSKNSHVSDEEFPFVVFAPQCYADTWFDIFEQLQEYVKMVASHPLVDERRLYLIGNSMGGYGAWQLAMTMPNYFAAIVPICGGGMKWNTGRLKNIPVWAFHGKEDLVVSVEESIRMVDAVNENGGTAKLTLLDNTGHNSWDYAYAQKQLFDWLLQQENIGTLQFDNKEYSDSKTFG